MNIKQMITLESSKCIICNEPGKAQTQPSQEARDLYALHCQALEGHRVSMMGTLPLQV